MKRRSIIQFAILMISLCLLLVVIFSQETSAEIITVAADGGGDYLKIQYALDNATSGDTIRVYEGTYHEQVIVNKSLTIEGAGTSTTHVKGTGTGTTIRIESEDVSLMGINISGGGYGDGDADLFVQAKNTVIENCLMSDPDSKTGILLNNTKHTIIRDTNITSHHAGIRANASQFLTIEDGNCSRNFYAVYLITASDSSISRTNCSFGTIRLDSSVRNLIEENNCSGNKIGFGIFLDAGSDDNTVRGNDCNNSHSGIVLRGSDGNTLTDNMCNNTLTNGIHLFEDSDMNQLTRNNCSGNGLHGISLYTDCDQNIITGSLINHNRDHGVHVRGNCIDNEVHQSEFVWNFNGGADTESNSEVDATYNYWGHYTGPFHQDTNSDGSGDSVTDDVNYDPWIEGENKIPVAFIDGINPSPAAQGISIDLTGHGEDDDSITQYAWSSSIDGEFLVTANAMSDHSGLSVGTHTISLKVLDERGAWSDPVTRQLEIFIPDPDNLAPTVTIDRPKADQVLDTIKFVISGTCDDPDGVTTIVRVEVKVNGEPAYEVVPEQDGTWNVGENTVPLGEGFHQIFARAYDGELYSEWVKVDFRIDFEEEDDWNYRLCWAVVIAFAFGGIGWMLWEQYKTSSD